MHARNEVSMSNVSKQEQNLFVKLLYSPEVTKSQMTLTNWPAEQ